MIRRQVRAELCVRLTVGPLTFDGSASATTSDGVRSNTQPGETDDHGTQNDKDHASPPLGLCRHP